MGGKTVTAQYIVHITQTVSCSLKVEASSLEDVFDTYYESDGMPGSITIGAFGYGATVDESGEWMVGEIEDSTGAVLWDVDKGFTTLTETSE